MSPRYSGSPRIAATCSIGSAETVRPFPEIVVATEPTELVSTDGEPEWKPLPDGNLIYAVNTETPWIRDVAGSQMYVLLSGRWFASQSQDGPWKFVRADKLPESFKQRYGSIEVGNRGGIITKGTRLHAPLD